jgi:hypothetical protein
MPGPSSIDVDAHARARRALVAMVMVPFSPIASTALSMRFVHTWLSSGPRTVSRGSERS